MNARLQDAVAEIALTREKLDDAEEALSERDLDLHSMEAQRDTWKRTAEMISAKLNMQLLEKDETIRHLRLELADFRAGLMATKQMLDDERRRP